MLAVLAKLSVLLIVLCAATATAVACSGGAAATSLKTTLSGGGKEGEEITVAEGSGVKDTATLSGEKSGKAGGTVTYAVYSDKECKTLVTKAGEVTVKEGKVPASEEKKLEAGAVYYWQAVYSGDANNAGSASACGKEVLTVKASISLKTTLSGGGKEGEEITVAEGSKAKDQATLSGTKSSTAKGTIKYAVYKDKECKELASKAGEGEVKEGKAPASEEKELEAGAVYYWLAEYEGDALHEASKSACGKEVLTVKASISLKTTLSGGGKEGEEITVAEGSKAKDQATLSGTKSSTAKGTIKYAVYKDKECKELASKAGEGEVKEGKAPASEEKELEAGAVYYWLAEYEGDSLHEASKSACGKEVETVKAEVTLTTRLVGEDPPGEKSIEGEEITVPAGAAMADFATLGGTNSAKATGAATYNVYADEECEELVDEAGEVSVAGKEAPPSEEEELEEGVYYWQAEYSGDSLHESAIGKCGSEVASVVGATTLTNSLSGEGETGDQIVVGPGSPVTDSATLTGPEASKATGTVKYFVYSDPECEKLVAEAGEASVEGESVPASSEEALEPGLYFWQAEYPGDGSNYPATSECGSATELVSPPITTTLSGEGFSGDQIEVLEGTSMTDEATLLGPNVAEATGTVKYFVYADEKCEELVDEAGEVSVSGSKVPASEPEKLEQGTYYWQAKYSGDKKNPASTSECGTEVAVVATSTSLTTSLSGGGEEGETIEVAAGTSVSDQATLSGVNASTAGGGVEYAVYHDSKCTELAELAGAASVSEGSVPASEAVALPEGTYYWQAEYTGDGVNRGATSECGAEIEVVKAPPLTTMLSGEERTGEEIEVAEGAGIVDKATLHGEHASEATGTVKYRVYADEKCEELVGKAGEVSVAGEEVPASKEEKFEEGTYYWQAEYSGDEKNPPATTACGSEIAFVANPPRKYAALGDSYSSGEGAGNYYANTDRGSLLGLRSANHCHRTRRAWPALVSDAFYLLPGLDPDTIFEQQPGFFIFRACSGAEVSNLWADFPNAAGGQYDEFIRPQGVWLNRPAQDLWLELPGGVLLFPLTPNASIKLVTFTISGNDANFATIARHCIEGLPRGWGEPAYSLGDCQSRIAAGIATFAAIRTRLAVVFADVLRAAPQARIRVPLYPGVLRVVRGVNIPVGLNGRWRINNIARGRAGVAPADLVGLTAAQSIESFIAALDRNINVAVAAAGPRVEIVNQTGSALEGHRLGNANPWINRVAWPWTEESFHPNECGHIAIANRFLLFNGEGEPPALCTP